MRSNHYRSAARLKCNLMAHCTGSPVLGKRRWTCLHVWPNWYGLRLVAFGVLEPNFYNMMFHPDQMKSFLSSHRIRLFSSAHHVLLKNPPSNFPSPLIHQRISNWRTSLLALRPLYHIRSMDSWFSWPQCVLCWCQLAWCCRHHDTWGSPVSINRQYRDED